MAQMTRGGRTLLDQLLADLADIDHAADIPRRDVILDPHGASITRWPTSGAWSPRLPIGVSATT